MKAIWYAVLFAVLIGCLVGVSKPQNDLEPARSYRMTLSHVRVSPDGTKIVLSERKKYAKANGEIRQTPYDSRSGAGLDKQAPAVARTDEGLFTVAPGKGERKEISSTGVNEKMQECFRSANCLRRIDTFVRTEEVAGLQVYVLRSDLPAPNPIEWVERAYSESRI